MKFFLVGVALFLSLQDIEIKKVGDSRIEARQKNRVTAVWFFDTKFPIAGFFRRGQSVYVIEKNQAKSESWLSRIRVDTGLSVFRTSIEMDSLFELEKNAILLLDCTVPACSTRVLNNNNGKFVVDYQGSLQFRFNSKVYFVPSGVRFLEYTKRPELLWLDTTTLAYKKLNFFIPDRDKCGSMEIIADGRADTIFQTNKIGFIRYDNCGEFTTWFSI
jgi:hypothetical protein